MRGAAVGAIATSKPELTKICRRIFASCGVVIDYQDLIHCSFRGELHTTRPFSPKTLVQARYKEQTQFRQIGLLATSSSWRKDRAASPLTISSNVPRCKSPIGR